MMKQLSMLTICTLITFMSCSQGETKGEKPSETKALDSHRYGGWYCPDNLNGFPAVDIVDWESVPVVNGRLPTQEETWNGTSLMFIDLEEYPEAKPLDIIMPRLATFYNYQSKKNEIVIVIQAINVLNDSIVGFRYLNGGNGSARLNAVDFLTDEEFNNLAASRFVSLSFPIKATQAEIWEVITGAEHSKTLQVIFNNENTVNEDWNLSSEVNFKYLNDSLITSSFGGNHFGNQYVQIDYELGEYKYVEKFLLLEDHETKHTALKIVCGPFRDDFESQKFILNNWALKVVELSEK